MILTATTIYMKIVNEYLAKLMAPFKPATPSFWLGPIHTNIEGQR